MMVEKIALFWGDDWEGLYINGKLVYENHNVDAKVIMRELAKHGMDAAEAEVDDDWLMEKGRLPEDATDVVVAK